MNISAGIMHLLSIVFLTLALLLSLCSVLSSSEFCLVSSLETKPVRISYLKKVQTPKTYVCCPNLSCDPPICTKYVTTLEKKWKVEMVTARVTRKKCCPGYLTEGDVCKPLCPGGCLHGECTSPGECTISSTTSSPPTTTTLLTATNKSFSTSTTTKTTTTTLSTTTKVSSSTLAQATRASSSMTTAASTGSKTPTVFSNTKISVNIPEKDKISAIKASKAVLIAEDLLIVLLSSLLFLLFIIAVILTIIYCRCKMKVMRDRHISKEMDRNRKSMQNNYVKKMTAARVSFDPHHHRENFENEILENKVDSIIDFDDDEYTPMN